MSTLLEGSGRPEGMDQRVTEVLASRATDQPINFDEADLEWARAWYAARIQVIDSLLDGFLAEMRNLGLENRATLIVLGSNGFALQEHGDLFGESLYHVRHAGAASSSASRPAPTSARSPKSSRWWI